MASKIIYEKAIRDRAKADGKGLFAVGCETKDGKWMMHGPCDEKLADKLTAFCIHTAQGEMTPRQVFNTVFGK